MRARRSRKGWSTRCACHHAEPCRWAMTMVPLFRHLPPSPDPPWGCIVLLRPSLGRHHRAAVGEGSAGTAAWRVAADATPGSEGGRLRACWRGVRERGYIVGLGNTWAEDALHPRLRLRSCPQPLFVRGQATALVPMYNSYNRERDE